MLIGTFLQKSNLELNHLKDNPNCKQYCILNKEFMMDLKTFSILLNHHRADLHQHGVKSLAVFGSLARGETTTSSDIDLLVEFDRQVGLFDFIRLKMFLEELTGKRIDLVTPEALRPAMRAEILNKAIYVS